MRSPAHDDRQLEIPQPIPPTRPQGKKALSMLQEARERGVSGVDFVRNYLFAYSQEVGRLKRRGYEIVSRPEEHSSVYRYFLAEFYTEAE